MNITIKEGMFVKLQHPTNTSYLHVIKEGVTNRRGEVLLGIFIMQEIIVDHKTNQFNLMQSDIMTEHEITDWLDYSYRCEGKTVSLVSDPEELTLLRAMMI